MSHTTPTNRVSNYLPTGPMADVDSLLRQFFGPVTSQVATAVRGGLPVSAWEEGDRLRLEFDAPGVTEEHVEITFDKGELSVSVERPTPALPEPQDEESQPTRTPLFNERTFGKTVRRLSLPETVDPDTIEASLTDGVLSVSIAKRPEAQPKRIEIRRG
ncbi:Spore protein SP21 [Pseudobythopirellula maris]|uniref:Spore protein SP21 n=1 Tax=Pseudobythopirellula maris TaxID=2527991 RepID=A0A5C5ZM41_9BACT|nr:Hsp20/alpha crystallin family protein [Pseudobythopirellula maris]TWT88524.1 Spore protein SP21 [Pseudobythopirellula maris]